MRHGAGAARLRPPSGADDLDRAGPPAGDRPGAPDRLAVPQPGRPRRLRASTSCVVAGPFLFTDEVRARFDLVGFDPRGIIRSTPLRCFGSPERVGAVLHAVRLPDDPGGGARAGSRPTATSTTPATDAAARSSTTCRRPTSRATSTCCARRSATRKLTYAGYSYGSYLGNTYANLFPDRVRALVVDGVLDPIAWSTGRSRSRRDVPFSTRLRSDAGAQATLNEFFRLCDAGGDGCAFCGGRGATRYAALADGCCASRSRSRSRTARRSSSTTRT